MDKAEREKYRTCAANHIKEFHAAMYLSPQTIIALLDHIDALEQKREGWKWVPVEPTPAMIDASYRGMIDTCSTDVYKAMIAAAPEPQ